MLRLILSAVLLAASASAQNLHEPFDYPDGPKIPNWTVETGSWNLFFGIAEAKKAEWCYLTSDNLQNVRSGAFEAEIYYPQRNGLHFAGILLRYQDPKSTAEHLVVKVQDTLAKGQWRELFLYERPLGKPVQYKVLQPGRFLVMRVMLRPNEWWAELDVDLDGHMDQVTPRFPISSLVPARGKVGINAYNNGRIGRFEAYEALLFPSAPVDPKIGTTFSLTLELSERGLARSNGQGTWLGLLSAGRTGIDLPGQTGMRLPLDFDFALVASLNLGWTGTVSNGSPQARMSLQIPNDSNLVGLDLHAGAVVFGAPSPLGIGAISNPYTIRIQ